MANMLKSYVLTRSKRKKLQFILVTLAVGFLISLAFSHLGSPFKASNLILEEANPLVLSDDITHISNHNSFKPLPKHMEPNTQYQLEFGGEISGQLVYYQSNFRNIEIFDLMYQRENATFFSLVRNSDLYDILKSIRSVESRFNKNYHYSWIFANDEPFNQNFITLVTNLVSGDVYFVEIPQEYWSYPSWIDTERAAITRERMSNDGIKYGGSESYRHMCRFNAGFFFQLDLMKNYKYYWRVEPAIDFRCDIDYDVFKLMRENNKTYGFNLAPLELHTTVIDLWETVQQFQLDYPDLVSPDNNMQFLTEDNGETYNMCHFWSNFEIGDLDFFRSDAYTKFFNHIDRAGGIFYQRWGDAPIHTIAVSLLQSKDKLQFFQNTGYYHSPNSDCPHVSDIRLDKNCVCISKQDFTWSKQSCIPKFFEIHDFEKPLGVPNFKFKNQHRPQAGKAVSDKKSKLNEKLRQQQSEKEKQEKERQQLESQKQEDEGDDIDDEDDDDQVLVEEQEDTNKEKKKLHKF